MGNMQVLSVINESCEDMHRSSYNRLFLDEFAVDSYKMLNLILIQVSHIIYI